MIYPPVIKPGNWKSLLMKGFIGNASMNGAFSIATFENRRLYNPYTTHICHVTPICSWKYSTYNYNRLRGLPKWPEHVASTYHITRTCYFYISYGMNHTVIRVSYRVSSRYQNPPLHGIINHTVIRVSYRVSGFQEDIKIPRPHGIIDHTVIRVSYRVSRRYQDHYHRHYHYHHHHHLSSSSSWLAWTLVASPRKPQGLAV